MPVRATPRKLEHRREWIMHGRNKSDLCDLILSPNDASLGPHNSAWLNTTASSWPFEAWCAQHLHASPETKLDLGCFISNFYSCCRGRYALAGCAVLLSNSQDYFPDDICCLLCSPVNRYSPKQYILLPSILGIFIMLVY